MDHQEVVSSLGGVSLSQHLTHTFLWMTAGLAVTAIVAFLTLFSGLWMTMYSFSLAPLVLLVAQLGVVIFLTGKLAKMQPSTAKLLFLAYSALTGITFSILPLAYGFGTMFIAFGFTALMFGSMAVIGMTTKKDLSGLGPILMAGLITMIVITIVGWFINLDAISMVMNYIMIGIFLGLTAYDMQKMRAMYYACESEPAMLDKISIYSALDLYLDFINIFLYVLRILGRSQKN